MQASEPVSATTFTLANAQSHGDILLDLNVEYMSWNNAELQKMFGISVAEVVGMTIPDYVASMIDKVCGEPPPRGSFYVVLHGGMVAGMGGLRQVRPGVSELKRVFVRPAFRGKQLGEAILRRALADAAAFGFQSMLLDTGPFMHAAHRLYLAAGFRDRAPYPEAEVPAVLHSRWRFMERVV